MKIVFFGFLESIHVRRWLRYLADKNYEVHLLTFNEVKKGIKRVKIHKMIDYSPKIPFFRSRIFGILEYFIRKTWQIILLRRETRRINPDVLHAHYITPFGIQAAIIGFHPLILSAWGTDIGVEPERSIRTRILVNFALRLADIVHTGDQIGKNRLLDLGCDEKKIYIQPWGINIDLFSPSFRDESLRRRLGISDRFSVIITRPWEPKYSVPTAIKAIPIVLKKIQNIRFIFCGGGYLKLILMKMAKELGVFKYIKFVGRIAHKDMPKYLASCDIYLDTLADYREDTQSKGGSGVGVSTLEAMACGTPQLMGDRMTVKYYQAQNWFVGLTYKQLDPHDLAEKLVYLFQNRELRKKIGLKSRKIAIKIGNWNKTMKSCEQMYTKFISC